MRFFMGLTSMLRFNLRARNVDDARAAIGMRGQLNDLEIESPADGGCAIAAGGPDRCCSTSLKLVMGNAGAAEIAISRSGRDAHAQRVDGRLRGVREHYDDRADDSRDVGLKGQPIRCRLPTDGVWFNYRRSGSRPYDIPYKRKNMHRSRFGDAVSCVSSHA
jgi:hypothetical protein